MATARSVPTLVVSLGAGPGVRLILDSGSVGLRVLASALPSGASNGIVTSGRPNRFAAEDGSVYRGVVARATVHIGGLSTATPVPFESITHIDCLAGSPHCPGLGDDPKVVGILGIAMYGQLRGQPVNPLLSLRAPYNRSWSIHLDRRTLNGQLTLGAVLPRGAKAVLDLPANHNPAAPPLAWYDSPEMCWRFEGHHTCGPTTFDTGSNRVFITGYPHSTHPGLIAGFDDKVALYAHAEHKPVWRFTSRYGPHTVVVSSYPRPTFTTGFSFFETHVVTFDDRDGRIYID